MMFSQVIMKCIGNNYPFLHIIIHIIHIFLFQPANANLRAYFPIKPMVYAFYITGHSGQVLHILKILFYNLFASYGH